MDTLPSRSSQTDPRPVWVVPLWTLLIVGLAIAYYWLMRSQPFDGDTEHYIAIANGHIAEVRQPFTSRVLHPAIVGFLSRTTGMSVDAAFFVTSVVSLAVLVSCGLSLILKQVRSLRFAAAIVLTPMVFHLFREIYMPDGMHAALAAVFFLLVAHGAWWCAVPLLFLMQVTRESTVLLTFFLVLSTAYHRMWKFAAAAIVFTLLGMGVVSHAAHQGLGNIHESNELVYLVGKVPFNLITNVTGIRMWTNTHAKNDPVHFPNKPIVSFDLPAWMPTGTMRQIGIYYWDPDFPLTLVRVLLTHLGILPSLVFSVIAWKRLRLVRDDRLSLLGLVALAYGVTSYLLVPCLGTALGRYAAYAWPMAWIAAPELLARYFNTSNRLIGQLVSFQIIACWTPLLLKAVGLASIPLNIVAIAVAIPCHIMAIKALRQNRIAEAG